MQSGLGLIVGGGSGGVGLGAGRGRLLCRRVVGLWRWLERWDSGFWGWAQSMWMLGSRRLYRRDREVVADVM